MIKAQDLRIWNLIRNQNGDVVDLTIEVFAAFAEFPFLLKEAEPIELSEEWLLKAKAVKAPEDDKYGGWLIPVSLTVDNESANKRQMRIMSTPNGFKWQSDMFMSVDLPFVHTLQNLAHALYGTELEFNH